MDAHHYSLTVSDLDAALEFYRDTLGFEEIHRTGVDSGRFERIVGVEDADATIAFLDGNGIVLELMEYHPPGDPVREGKQDNDAVGAHHVAFEVDDATAWYEEHEADVEFINPPQSGGTGAVAAYFYDPEGNVLEIVERGSMDYLEG